MATTLEVEFFNPYDSNIKPLILRWEVYNSAAATVWLRSLYQSLKKEQLFYARFTGFENSPKDLKFLSQKMNEAIDIINFEGKYPNIKERADGTFSQKFANVMHHHFELLFGDAKDPSSHFKNSTYIGKAAISLLNHCVHDMEALTRAKENNESSRAVVFEILDRQQFALPDSMKEDFTFELNFGDICLHYGLVGKTWWEVFLDEDEEIFSEGIRPLDVIGPEFDIHFHQRLPSKETREDFYKFLKKHGQDPSDPNLCLGFLPVAKLTDLHSSEEISEEVGRRSGVKSITLKQDNKVWLSRDFQSCRSCQEGFFRLNPLKIISQGESLESHGFPNEAFIISGEQEKTILCPSLTKGPIVEAGHALAIYVPKDGNSVVVPVSEAKRGFLWKEDIVINPGEYLCMLYDGECWYSPVLKEDER